MDCENVLGERLIPTYEELKSGLLRLIDEGKISREDAARVLPELRESKDERVRKAIRLILIATEDEQKDFYSTHGLARKDCTDWLEKQKEQKHVMGNGISEQTKMDETVYKFTPEEWKKALDEQLPKEPKPAGWSEEDEKMVRFYEDDYDNNLGNMPMRDVIENRIKFKEWLIKRLKSLRPQPKRDCKDCAMFLNGECTKPHWKPSEEQMNILEEVINNVKQGIRPYASEIEHLEELREQLKKL